MFYLFITVSYKYSVYNCISVEQYFALALGVLCLKPCYLEYLFYFKQYEACPTSIDRVKLYCWEKIWLILIYDLHLKMYIYGLVVSKIYINYLIMQWHLFTYKI